LIFQEDHSSLVIAASCGDPTTQIRQYGCDILWQASSASGIFPEEETFNGVCQSCYQSLIAQNLNLENASHLSLLTEIHDGFREY